MSSKNRLKTTSFTVNLGLVALLVGCGASIPTQKPSLTTEFQHSVSTEPDYLQSLYKTLYLEGQHNEVLNRLEIGSSAFYHGDIEQARVNFDAALNFIESTFANNENALKARSLWHEEGRKDFRGEPYERAMAYYYRGLIYLIDAEYDNARASFMNALMQDAFAEEEQNRSDFLLMMYLVGWSSQKMGSAHLAQEAWDELKQFQPDFIPPSADCNILVVAETGASPRKLADGVGHYQLVYRRGKNFTEKRVELNKGNIKLTPQPTEDIYFQAASRGGRPVDAIIEGKAKFRQTNESMGEALADLGSTTRVMSSGLGGNAGNVANALSLVGVAQLMIASKTKPRADTRYWSRLPDVVHITALQKNNQELGSSSDWHASYLDMQHSPVSSTEGNTFLFTDKNGQTLIWHKSREY